MSSQDSESSHPVWSPDQILVATFGAAVQQKLELPEAFELVGSEDLARAATAETVERVLGFYAGLAEQKQPVVFVLAALLERHASRLDDVGRCDLAVPIYAQIAEVYERQVPPLNLGNFRNHRAIALWHLGRHADALALDDAALPLLKEHASPGRYADCLMDRANVLISLGRHAEALAGLDAALPMLRGYSAGAEAICLLNRGNVLTNLGRHREAVASYAAARPIFEAQKMTTALILCRGNQAAALTHVGRHAEALAGYDEALPLLKDHAPPGEYGSGLMNRANALRNLGRLAEALDGYGFALPLLRDHAPKPTYANGVVNRAAVLAELGHREEAVAELERAVPLLEAHAPADLTRALLNRAHALYQLGRHAEAVAGFRQTRAVLRQSRRWGGIDETSTEFITHHAGVFAGAISAALACDDLESAYSAVCEGKAGLLTDQRPRAAVDREPPEVALERRALTDCLRKGFNETTHDERDEATRRYLAIWGQHYHAYDPTRRESSPDEDVPSRELIQSNLPRGWALIDFWHIGVDKFLAFVLSRDSFTLHELSLATNEAELDELFDRLGRLRDSFADLESEPQLDGLKDLHLRLFAPLLPLLREKQIQGLYLVPHDFLHHMPLHATYEEEDGQRRYLCDEFAVAYLPSAALLPQLPPLDVSGRAFVLANPEAGTRHELPYAQWEGERLRDSLNVPPEQCFLGATGTLAATRAWTGCSLVHFGCHGLGDTEFSPRSHLRLADDLLLAHDVAVRCEPINRGALVILNGCQTSVLDDRAVNEGLGLMTAFLARGASLVLSTQWSVADRCAAEMVLEFVDQVRNRGLSPAQSLRLAQRHVRALSAEVRMRHFGFKNTEEASIAPLPYDNPVYWAAFQLVGRVT